MKDGRQGLVSENDDVSHGEMQNQMLKTGGKRDTGFKSSITDSRA